MRGPRRMKPSLVEWDLTGSEDSGFGAVVFLSAVPVRIVKEFEAMYSNDAEVTGAVDEWLRSVSERYVVNAEFQAFKATARNLDEEAHPTRQAGQWWRPLD